MVRIEAKFKSTADFLRAMPPGTRREATWSDPDGICNFDPRLGTLGGGLLKLNANENNPSIINYDLASQVLTIETHIEHFNCIERPAIDPVGDDELLVFDFPERHSRVVFDIAIG